MIDLFKLVLPVLAFALSLGAPAQVRLADGTVLASQPLFIIAYVEVVPAAGQQSAALLAKHAAASRVSSGNLGSHALQEIARPNRFVLLETWQHQAARDANAVLDRTRNFRRALQALLITPYDERPHAPLAVAQGSAAGSQAVYAVTHLDIIPAELFPPCKRQASENGPCGLALARQLAERGRQHAGNLRFDALTQASRPNHMTLVEVWSQAADQQAYAAHADTRQLRAQLSGVAPGADPAADPLHFLNPLSGSLYDERLYKNLD